LYSRKNAPRLILRGYSVGRAAFLFPARIGQIHALVQGVFGSHPAGDGAAPAATAPSRFGPQGEEGAPNREQQWLVPSPDPDIAAHAVLFWPPAKGRSRWP
jgi:hypothetical protein